MSILSKIRHWSDGNRRQYLWRSLSNCCVAERQKCPNCGSKTSKIVHRKLLVTTLRRCSQCALLFRTPTDPPSFGEEFYQDDYDQGFTTDCPDESLLAAYLRESFQGTPKDFSDKLKLVNWLGVLPGSSILDFGASWGYGTWQFQKAGYKVQGFEPGRSRARYAREKLSVDVVDDFKEVEGSYDLIFSSHVMEHVPNPSDVISQLRDRLKPGGYFLAFTPNGSNEYCRVAFHSYHRHWGMVHPNYLDELFYEKAFTDWPTLMSKTPVTESQINAWPREGHSRLALDGWELLAIAQKPN